MKRKFKGNKQTDKYMNVFNATFVHYVVMGLGCKIWFSAVVGLAVCEVRLSVE